MASTREKRRKAPKRARSVVSSSSETGEKIGEPGGFVEQERIAREEFLRSFALSCRQSATSLRKLLERLDQEEATSLVIDPGSIESLCGRVQEPSTTASGVVRAFPIHTSYDLLAARANVALVDAEGVGGGLGSLSDKIIANKSDVDEAMLYLANIGSFQTMLNQARQVSLDRAEAAGGMQQPDQKARAVPNLTSTHATDDRWKFFEPAGSTERAHFEDSTGWHKTATKVAVLLGRVGTRVFGNVP